MYPFLLILLRINLALVEDSSDKVLSHQTSNNRLSL
jgi:hypothetical protein